MCERSGQLADATSSTTCASAGSARPRAPRPRCSTTASGRGSRRTSCRPARWVEIIEACHRSGLRSTSTVMFGHIEEPWELARHMRVDPRAAGAHRRDHRVRAALFIPFQTLLGRTHGIEEISRGENLKHTAAFRLALGRTITNLQASWVKMGLDAATESLRWGVNDLGGTLMEENISRMAGSQHGVRLEPEDLIGAARAARAHAGAADDALRDRRDVLRVQWCGCGRSASRRRSAIAARTLRPTPGTSSIRVENSREVSTSRCIGVCAVTVAERGRGVQQRHLAEAVAGLHHLALATTDGRFRRSILDHEALAPGLTLAHENPSFRDLDLGRQRGDPAEVALAAAREQLYLRESLELRIASASPACACHRGRVSHRLPAWQPAAARRAIIERCAPWSSPNRAARWSRASSSRPAPGSGQVRVRVLACGVCRTDLHIVDGELPEPKLPLVLGHQVVGEVAVRGGGDALRRRRPGRRPVARLGLRRVSLLPLRAREPLRAGALHRLHARRRLRGARGRRRALLPRRSRRRAPTPRLAPLLCAGTDRLPGAAHVRRRRAARAYGFGASAHLVCQVAAHQGRRVFAITRAPATRSARRSRAASAPSGRAGPTSCRRSSTRRSSSRPPASWSSTALRALAPGGVGGLRGDPHERHPFVRLRGPLARAPDPLGRQPHPPRRRASSSPLVADEPRGGQGHRVSRSSDAARRSTTCAPGGSRLGGASGIAA